MKSNLIILFSLAIFLFACEDHNHNDTATGTVNLVIKAKYGAEPLVLDQKYAYFGKDTLVFTNLEFFLSNITLKGSHTHSLSTIQFIDLDSKLKTKTESELGYILQFSDVDATNYTAVNFSIGVPSSLNVKSPIDFKITDPLGEPSRYWDGWKSYIFSKVEGKYSDPNSTSCKEKGFAYHSGFDTALRTIDAPKPMVVEAGKTTTINIEIDFKSIFGNSASSVDICKDPVFHEANAFMEAFMTRFQSAITVK
ncbi:MAG: hypothetical protein IPH96_02405 [Saprospiraceae bacterium]|nr:hypothetical protein [Saprospiraceae bacterium]